MHLIGQVIVGHLYKHKVEEMLDCIGHCKTHILVKVDQISSVASCNLILACSLCITFTWVNMLSCILVRHLLKPTAGLQTYVDAFVAFSNFLRESHEIYKEVGGVEDRPDYLAI